MTTVAVELDDEAAAARRALAVAIAASGPTPCQSSNDAEIWYLPPMAPVAVALCSSCPVKAECLAYALASDERWGVWGAVAFDPAVARLLPRSGRPRRA